MLLLPWLLPNRAPPWSSFYNEVAMPIALVPLAAWLIVRSRAAVRLPLAAVGVALLAAVPVLQWFGGRLHYSGDALLAMLYLLGLTACIAIGARWRDIDVGEAARLVFVNLALAALLSTQLALMQWLRTDPLGVLVSDLPVGWRPTANISQANHLCSLLVLGLVSVWGLCLRRDIRPSVAWLAAAYLLFGVAMTQSRTGWLQVGLLLVAAAVWRHRLCGREHWPGILGLATLFIVLVLCWPAINHALGLDGGLTLGDQMQSGRRPDVWRVMAGATLASPWWGHGWGQVGLAQQSMAATDPALHLLFTYAHNLWLDLLLWNGIPLGTLACVALIIWFWRQSRRVRSTDETLLLLGLLALLLHAQLEFPHAYAYFLLPAGLMAGLLPSARDWPLRRGVAAVLVAGLTIALAGLLIDYMRAERAWLQVRMVAAHIRTHPDQAVPPLRWLDQLQGLIEQSGADPRQVLDEAQQAAFRASVARFPAPGSLYRLALMEAHHAHPERATDALQRLCSLSPAPMCASAARGWREAADADAALRAVRLPAAMAAQN